MNYVNPYPNGKIRIHADISEEDFNLVKLMRPAKGTIQTTINLLWKKLCDELRKRQITDYARRCDFELFVTNCIITDSGDGRPVAGSLPPTDVHHDGTRTEAVRYGNPAIKTIPSVVQVKGSVGRRRGVDNKQQS